MNQCSGRPARRPAALIFSAKIWKSVFCLSGETGKVPFGPGKPSRVPCPPATVKAATDVADDDLILDIGPQTAKRLADQLLAAGTIVWNGPVGVFEFDQFGGGTRVIAEAIARSPAFSLAGGGDTLAAIEKYGVEQGISYISTGGGAFLEFVEGKTLPAVAALEARADS